MATNPFQDLADSLNEFGEAWDRITGDEAWADGSNAANECSAEPLADEWGAYPSRDALISAVHRIGAGLDHLRALAILLPTDDVVLPLSTVARGAMEGFAWAYFLGEPGIGARERVRRYTNTRLASLHEVGRMLTDSPGEEGEEARRRNAKTTLRLVESARRQGFTVRDGRDAYRATRLGAKSPSITDLCEVAVSRTPGLGSFYYRHLSSVAHHAAHGLTPHIAVLSPLLDRSKGDAVGYVTVTAKDAAQRLMGAPLSAVSVVDSTFPLLGWDVEAMRPAVDRLLLTWGRIAEVPHPDA